MGQVNKRPFRGSPCLVLENDSIMVPPPHVAHVGIKNMNEHHETIW